MRSLAAATTCSLQGYELYGRRLLTSFDRHWPQSVPLHVYAEGFTPDVVSPRVFPHDLLASSPELDAFRRRHGANPDANGRLRRRVRLVAEWRTMKFRLRRVTAEDAFRWEAVRFAHKSFALFHAAARCDADVLFWLDADIVVFADVPLPFLDELVPPDCFVAFLARPNHSECGLVGYNLRHPAVRQFLERFRRLYVDDLLFREAEYHDAYLFDRLRREFERCGHRSYDMALGAGLATGRHVFVNSALGRYMDHLKGDRKASGCSRAADFRSPSSGGFGPARPGMWRVRAP
jgi:hypothetical protein